MMDLPSRCNRLALMLLLALVLPLVAACGSPATPTGQGTQLTAPAAQEPTTASAAEEPTTAPATEPPPTEEGAAQTPSEGGKILRVQTSTYPDVIDPQKSSFANEISVLSLNYEGLTKLDQDLKAVPAAAESWEFNDSGDEITFKLRADLQYSDGEPLTSENFRYAIERTCDPETAGEYQSILFEIIGCQEFATAPMTDTAAIEAGREKLAEGVLTPDERTLILRLTNPAPYYTFIAGLWVMYPARQDLIEAGGEDWWKDPTKQIGNGPFQVTQMTTDQLISLEANPNYWEGKPKLDGLEFVFIKDSAVALEAYKAGQVDIMAPDPSQIPALKADPVLSKEFLSYPGANSYAFGFNLTKEPFQDKKVREAFAYALDRQTYCEVIRNGDCIPSLSWIPQGLPGSVAAEEYAFNPEKAKQALAESSYGGPEALPEVKLTYNSDDPAAQPRIEWIAGQLRDILGINVTLDPTDGTTLTAMRKDPATYPQACIFCSNWFQDYPDPQNWLSVLYTCDSIAAQRISYCNPKFDELTDAADRELDPTKREQLYEQASEVLNEDLPLPYVYNLAVIFLVKPEVTGYKTTVADVQWPGQWGSMLTVDINR
jgi:oligopeptide transport system substrate-binding protein